MAYRMKGHSLPGPNQRKSPAKTHNKIGDKPIVHNPKSPAKQKYDVNGTDTRAYNIDQNKYDKWRGTEDINTGEKGNAPNIRYIGAKENKKHLEDYLKFKKSGGKKVSKKEGTTIKNPGARGPGPEVKTTTVIKSSEKKSPGKMYGKKSPAKIAPLVAMAGKAILGKVAGKAADKLMG